MNATLTRSHMRPAAPAAPGAWETEAFVLRGPDRARLAERALALARFLEANPCTNPTDLAATLAAESGTVAVTLGLVASTIDDLRTKLTRAAGRLADPTCKQIRDSAGIYYFDRPLYAEGTLALLYPGEGAQYLGMLADLCEPFPEVEGTFAWCDQLAIDSGKPEQSIRKALHLPANATAEQKALAEAELRKIGPSLLGVLGADLAMTQLLQQLRLPVSAVAGHSAGEMAALLAAGAMPGEYVLGPKLSEVFGGMQAPDETGSAEFALIAVGAGKADVSAIALEVAGGAVVVAMDNCPHQCIAVGPTHLVAAVEAALIERGLMCERLPFNRPYHTPLFEPWMAPFRAMFAKVPFVAPHTPVYSCSSAQKFPDDPDAIRELTVNHWVTPVEYTRMIETMHADGVRIFVEAGPRGNLSAFTEDVLRGKSFAAIPANLPRRNGVTQVNHLVAQLSAHGVPVNLSHLFSRRETKRVEWEVRNNPSLATHVETDRHASSLKLAVPTPHPPPQGGRGPEESEKGLSSASVMDGYLAVMEQFLDVQREVMEAYLSGAPLVFADAPVEDLSRLTSAAREDQFCLVGEIVRHEPGVELVFRQPLDLNEDLHADDHTLGGRGVSRVDPNQNGLPILPMTFSLEAMAQAASVLVPGKVVVAIKNVRLFRWVPFDAEPTTLEVRAQVSSLNPETGEVEVSANVRDLGNSFAPDAADKASSEAVVVLADAYPPSPAALPFTLTNETRCKSTVEDLRRNMFHGPLFHMLQTLDRIGDEGIEGTLVVHERDKWFRSNPDPRVVIDPVLVDAAMHIIGAWHLEQPDWTGRILLPFDLEKLEFFGPPPAPGTNIFVRGHNVEASARHFRNGLEVFLPDGTIWMRLTRAGYWRFYLPFGNVNFFGPKDQYFLSRNWPEAVPTGSAFGRCHSLEPPTDLKQAVLRASGARVTMTPREMGEYGSWKGADVALNDWFFGRMVAKDAVRASWFDKTGVSTFPADMESESDVDGRVSCRPRGAGEPFQPVSVAVAGGTVVAFSAFAKHVGIALAVLPKKATESAEECARFDAAKRAVAEALRIGPDGMTAIPGESAGSVLVGLPPVVATRYPEWAGKKLRVQTARQKDLIAATTTCEPA